MRQFHRAQLRYLGLVFVSGLLSLAAAENPPATTVVPRQVEAAADRVAKLIEQLGATDFGVRERAQSELAQAGLEAYDALHAAQSHHDPEIALRSRYLVRSMSGSVRWFADSDSPKVVAILKEYGDLSEAEKKNRIDRLAALEGGTGLTPLIRLARFETVDSLAKYAALQVFELSPPVDDAAKAALAKNINAVAGTSKRQAAAWLRLYGRTLADPLATLAEWDQATKAEHAVLDGKNSDRTTREIVRDLYRFQVNLLHRLGQQDDANVVVRRMFALLDGLPDRTQQHLQVQEFVDWLLHRQAWTVAAELMQKYDPIVQDNARLLYRLAGVHDKLGDAAKADATAKTALALKPESLDDHILIAHELEETPGLEKWAEPEYRHVLASATPGTRADFAARFGLSELLHDRLQELPAAETLQPVCDVIQKDEAAKETAYRAQRIAEAVIARMHYFYACHFHEQGDRAKEKEHLKKALDAYYKDADVLIAMYRVPDADEEWKAMTKEKIEAVAAEFYREVEEGRRMFEEADNDQLTAAKYDFARDCNQYAWLVGNTFGDFQEAIKLSRESVKICQQLPEQKASQAGFLDTLGRAYYGAGDIPNAVKNQALAVALSPASGQIRRQLEFFQKEARDRGLELPATDSAATPPAAEPAQMP
jgi:hypothetical protein